MDERGGLLAAGPLEVVQTDPVVLRGTDLATAFGFDGQTFRDRQDQTPPHDVEQDRVDHLAVFADVHRNPQVDLGLPDDGVVAHQPRVAGHHDLAATAEAGAVDHADDRLRAGLDEQRQGLAAATPSFPIIVLLQRDDWKG